MVFIRQAEPPLAKRSRYRKAALALISLGASGLFSFLALEIGLRLSDAQPDFFFQLDPEVGAIHIPGKKGWHRFEGGRQYVEINSHGYRDRERALTKVPGTVRIAVLGDSFVEAFQVPLEATFTYLLEERLNEACGQGPGAYEVLSFGVSGFGTGQELETLRHRVLPFDPDWVLLFLYPSNDLFDNSLELDVEPNRLHFELDARGRLVRLPYEVRDNALKRWLRHHSKAYLFVRDRVKRVEALRRALVAIRAMQPEGGGQAEIPAGEEALGRLRESRYQLPLSPVLERAWRLTEALIVAADRLAREAPARFGLVVIPNREEILDTGPPPEVAPGSWDAQQSLGRARVICRRHSLDCLHLVNAFRASGHPAEKSYLPGDGHWTRQGHALVARETLRWLRDRICPRSDERGATARTPGS